MLFFFEAIWSKVTAIFHGGEQAHYPMRPEGPPHTPWPAEYRYTEWAWLDHSMQDAASDLLGYTKLSWNNPGVNPVEGFSYESLTEDEQLGSFLIGLAEDHWDCWVNHYNDYYWWELEDEGVADCYKTLGWNEAKWETKTSVPATEEFYWNSLTRNEQAAAECLCYFEDLWNGELALPAYTLPDHYYSYDSSD